MVCLSRVLSPVCKASLALVTEQKSFRKIAAKKHNFSSSHPETSNHTLLTLNLYCSAERMYRKYPSVCSDATVKISGLTAGKWNQRDLFVMTCCYWEIDEKGRQLHGRYDTKKHDFRIKVCWNFLKVKLQLSLHDRLILESKLNPSDHWQCLKKTRLSQISKDVSR